MFLGDVIDLHFTGLSIHRCASHNHAGPGQESSHSSILSRDGFLTGHESNSLLLWGDVAMHIDEGHQLSPCCGRSKCSYILGVKPGRGYSWLVQHTPLYAGIQSPSPAGKDLQLESDVQRLKLRAIDTPDF